MHTRLLQTFAPSRFRQMTNVNKGSVRNYTVQPTQLDLWTE